MSDDEKPDSGSIFDTPENAEQPSQGAETYNDDGETSTDMGGMSVDEKGHLRASVDTGDIDPYDHSTESAAVRNKAAKEGVAPAPLPEPHPEPPRNPAVMADADDGVRAEMDRRFEAEFGEMKVEVTQAEKEAFVRAALQDVVLVLDIELEGLGTMVEVAIPPDAFTNEASAACGWLGREDAIDSESDLQWLLTFQQMHAWYQVRSIDGTPTEWSNFWADGMPTMQALRSNLRDMENLAPFQEMNAVRWRMILQAVRIAELKYKICLENWKNRSFFTGADTA